MSIRKTAVLFVIRNTTLHRALKLDAAPDSLEKKARTYLHPNEETIIKDAVIHLSQNGTPLSRCCFLYLVQTFVTSIPLERRKMLPFINGRPVETVFKGYMKRHKYFCLERRSNLENIRAKGMPPEVLVQHFVRLNQAYVKYNIKSPQ